MESRVNYKAMSEALFYFDAMLDGEELEIIQQNPAKYRQINAINKKVIEKLMVNEDDIDAYVRETFAAFCNKRERIILKREVIKSQYHSILDLILFSTKPQSLTTAPTQTNNLFKPVIFNLFPNLKEIRIDYEVSLWNFIDLYSKLKEWKPTTKVTIKNSRYKALGLSSFEYRILVTPQYHAEIISLFVDNELTATFTDDDPLWKYSLVISKSDISSKQVEESEIAPEEKTSMITPTILDDTSY